MKELWSKGFWRDVKKTFEDARDGAETKAAQPDQARPADTIEETSEPRPNSPADAPSSAAGTAQTAKLE